MSHNPVDVRPPFAEHPTDHLDIAAISVCLEALQSGNFQLTAGGSEVFIKGVLGAGGGTKTVYDAFSDGEAFALALPNPTDNEQTAYRKWQVALNEPAMTDQLRDLGLVVNPDCQVWPVEINDTPFPAIKMLRYQDMPLQIRDGKNPTFSTIEHDLFPDNLDLSSFLEKTEGVRKDIAVLVKNGLVLNKDSFNICILNEEIRVFFNDLGDAQLKPSNHNTPEDYVAQYSLYAIGVLKNAMSEPEWQRHGALFNGPAFNYQGEAYQQFAARVMDMQSGL
jgi:hypothetical protein